MIFAWLLTLARAGDAPEISRSVGRPEGVVVLWPRVFPDAASEEASRLAAGLQRLLRDRAAERFGDRVDVRPQPEWSCPRDGCRAASVGLVLAVQGGGCAAALTLGEPEGGPVRLVPWVGTFQVELSELPFREPPEGALTVLDLEPCQGLLRTLATDRTRERALRDALSSLR